MPSTYYILTHEPHMSPCAMKETASAVTLSDEPFPSIAPSAACPPKFFSLTTGEKTQPVSPIDLDNSLDNPETPFDRDHMIRSGEATRTDKAMWSGVSHLECFDSHLVNNFLGDGLSSSKPCFETSVKNMSEDVFETMPAPILKLDIVKSMSPSAKKKSVSFSPTEFHQICLFRRMTSPIEIQSCPSYSEPDLGPYTSPSSSSDDEEDEVRVVAKSRLFDSRCLDYGLECVNIPRSSVPFYLSGHTMRLETSRLVLEPCQDKVNLVGFIQVKNLDYSKRVFVRCTWDKWATCQDVDATFMNSFNPSEAYAIAGQHGVGVDRFRFAIPLKAHHGRTELEFAFCYQVLGHEYWDNNDGRNFMVALTRDAATLQKPCSSQPRSRRRFVSLRQVGLANFGQAAPSLVFHDKPESVIPPSLVQPQSVSPSCPVVQESRVPLPEPAPVRPVLDTTITSSVLVPPAPKVAPPAPKVATPAPRIVPPAIVVPPTSLLTKQRVPSKIPPPLSPSSSVASITAAVLSLAATSPFVPCKPSDTPCDFSHRMQQRVSNMYGSALQQQKFTSLKERVVGVESNMESEHFYCKYYFQPAWAVSTNTTSGVCMDHYLMHSQKNHVLV